PKTSIAKAPVATTRLPGMMDCNTGVGGVPKISAVANVEPLPPAKMTPPFGSGADANSRLAWIKLIAEPNVPAPDPPVGSNTDATVVDVGLAPPTVPPPATRTFPS